MRCTRPARVTTAAPRAPRDIVITRACDDAFAAVFRDDDDEDEDEDTAEEDEDDGTIARAAIVAVGIAAAARCDDEGTKGVREKQPRGGIITYTCMGKQYTTPVDVGHGPWDAWPRRR